MDADKEVTAEFTKLTYTITPDAAPAEGGTISPDTAVTVDHGGSQLFEISTNDGYKIDSVLVDGEDKGTDPTYEFTNVTTDHTITASFAKKEYELTTTVTGDGTGGSGTVVTSPDSADNKYEYNTEVTLTASPDNSSAFVEWSGATTSDSTSVELTMDEKKSVTAHFALARETTFKSGTASDWELVSYPLEALTPEFSSVFGELAGNTFYTFQADGSYSGTYKEIANSDTVSNTEGYWGLFQDEQEVQVLGSDVTKNVNFQFPEKGWYMISTPYASNWGDDIVSHSDMATDGVGHVRLVVWDSASGNYVNYYSDVETYDLKPWQGYWVKAKAANASLELEKKTSPSGTPSSVAASTASSYQLPASVNADELDMPPAPPGVQEQITDLEITAAPNPVSEPGTITFKVTSGNAALVSNMRVEVFAASGSQVFMGESSGSALQWNAEGISNGVYLYRVNAEVGSSVLSTDVQKLLVVR